MHTRRLYLRLYLAFLGVLLAVVVVVGAIGFLTGRPFFALHRGSPKFMAHLGRMLPPPSDPAALARAVADINEELGMDVAVLGPGGEVIAAAGNPVPAPDPDALELARRGPLWVARGIIAAPTRGGGILLVRPPLPEGAARRAVIRAALLVLGAVAVSLALVYPLSRSITRPLEKLTSVVEAYGRGDLSQRSGLGDLHDEVGRLARSFDEMADRIQATRRAEKELLANVSHELRTPLARIKVALELIDAPEEGVRRRLATISEEVDELDRLVADVLTATRLDLAALPLRKVRTDLAMLIDRARLRALALDPSLPMDLEVEPGLSIEADEALLSRALDNLLDNARKYGNGSAVEVRARREGEDAVLSVRDRGPGIAEKDLPHVFDPFFRGEGAPGLATGFGLGLALARRVAEVHGGTARAQNAEEGGARIELRLPLNGIRAADAARAG
ncbi:MAG TPA: HAMP domain-containing sensor histidine kinase [Myxococcales bacterium]|nr:HAMP domain-containing sensor histidine kinase [Myxococcales bacterium]